MNTFLVVTAFVVIAFIVGATVLPNLRGASASRHREPRVREGEALPYQPKLFLSRAEKEFYRALRAALGDEGVVFAQVPISSVIRVAPDATSRQSWHNKIDRKTVDFLVCDPTNLDPIAAIELDDRSHEAPKRVERDAFVNEAFAAAGVKLLRVPARSSPAPGALREMILGM